MKDLASLDSVAFALDTILVASIETLERPLKVFTDVLNGKYHRNEHTDFGARQLQREAENVASQLPFMQTALGAWRNTCSHYSNLPPYTIAHDAVGRFMRRTDDFDLGQQKVSDLTPYFTELLALQRAFEKAKVEVQHYRLT
jgi:capsule polysaccharide export protein KpsC/LpsZ